ncbi:Trm112 family protein [Lysobacter sp. CA199]|uniref:Trm112 family protein n=1 Tax=Lysobacter sp. CA199 TaxID=3455608 RepID=UPI003F8D0B43
MDRKLLDLLVCPSTRQPLLPLEGRGLQALNTAIGAGGVVRGSGDAQSQALHEALITRDRKIVYIVDDGIPLLDSENAIGTAQVDGFPGA